MQKFFFGVGLLTLLLPGCNINKDLMFKTDREYQYAPLSDEELKAREYRIAVNDVLMFTLFTNKGKRLMEVTTGSNEEQRNINFGNFTFPVLADGYVNFPELGRVKVTDFTVIELQVELEKLYDALYNDTFVVIKVMNNRVIVFPGSGADARVIPIENNNVTVIEMLAAAGGIAQRGNAAKVKLIRRAFKQDGEVESKVYLMDLSTIEGIRFANMTVQSNDIIYVEPVPELGREILQELSPIISLLSGMGLLYTVFILRFRTN